MLRPMKLAWVVVGVLAVGGCKKQGNVMEERRKAVAVIVEKRRPEVAARLDVIKALGKDAQAAPKVTAREPLLQKIEEIDSGHIEWAVSIGSVEAFLEPVYKGMSFPRYGFNVDIAKIDQILAGTNVTDLYPYEYEEYLTGFLKPVAVVVRYHEEVLPQQADATHFTAGYVIGDAILYDTATKKRIGAFPFEARQGDTADPKSLLSSFHGDVRKAIDEELVAYALGKPGPASVGRAADTPEALRDRLVQKVVSDKLILGFERYEIREEGEGCTLVLHVSSTMNLEETSSLLNKRGPVKKEFADPLVQAIERPCAVVYEVVPKPAEAP